MSKQTVRELLQTALQRLEALDFGHIETLDATAKEAALQELEHTIDALSVVMPTQEGNLAIRYFLTDPQRSRSYLWGPTDVSNGVGLIEKIRTLTLR